MEYWLDRTEKLIGKKAIEKLAKSHVAIFGIGGVGSYALEGLVRAGIGHIAIVDKDVVSITNLNRQLIADHSTIGMPKVEVAKKRVLLINPDLQIETYQDFFEKDHSDFINLENFDYILDCIDTVSSKLLLIELADEKNIKIISCMGTGNKLDPTKFQIADISKTSVCPLAKVIRKELRQRNISSLKVLFSTEAPQSQTPSRTPASISFVPSIAGLILAGEVIKDIINP